MRCSRRVSLLLLLVPLVGAALIWLMRSRSAPAEITGQVTDGRRPVPGARVRFQGRSPVTITDADGRFRLERPPGGGYRVAVSHEGFVIQTFAADRLHGSLVLGSLPAADDPAYEWVEPGPRPAGAQNCVNCHAQIYREWQGSAHARAAVNRHFLNFYDGSDWHGRTGVGWNLQADNRDGAAVCAACHAPTVSGTDLAFGDIRQVHGVDQRGVHCDFCHKIKAAEVDERALTFGRFGYQLLRPVKGQLFFGPLDDAERAGESFSYLPLYRESRYCASCHEGVIFGVPVYTTYSEWLASPARREGKQCQSCHMAPTGSFTNIAPGKGGIERDPGTLATHHFPGAQAAMLRRCLKVSGGVTRRNKGVLVRAEVRAAGVGHRVPTGFIDRNLVLVVEALDSSGKPVPLQSGPTLPHLAGKQLTGKAGRLYAKQLIRRNGSGPVPFWQAHDKLVDTRLQPDTADRAHWRFGMGADRVRVRLLYRRIWKEIADKKRWPDNEIAVLEQTWKAEGQQWPGK